MPSFLHPWNAAIAAGIVIPALLALYFLKLRRREFDVSSTLLWRKAIQDLQVNAPFQRLRRNLLLLLQLILLALLLLALARPVMNYSPGAGKISIIAIDRSASMQAVDIEGKRRIDEAKRVAKEIVDTMEKDATAMVIAFDDSADIVRSFTSDHLLLKQSIDSIETTDRRSRGQLAFQLAEAKVISSNVENRGAIEKPDFYFISDGRLSDSSELTMKFAKMQPRIIGTKEAHNIGVVSFSAKRNYERPTEVQIFARLANFGIKPAQAVVQLSVDGVVVPQGIKRGIMLIPERWTPEEREKAEKKDNKLQGQSGVEFQLELLKGATVRLELKENAGDVLAADDAVQVIVPPPRSLSVALVSGEGNLWLQKFLESANLKDPQTLTPVEYEARFKDGTTPAAFDVFFFDRYQPKTLPPAGNFVYFNAVPPNSKLKAARDAIGPIVLKDQTVLDWDRGHPMLRGLNIRFLAAEALKLQVPLDAQTLIEGRQGPLVVLHRDGRSTHLVIGFDVQESSWPTSPSFPVFLDNALQYVALGSEMDVRPAFQPGATPKIPRYLLQQAGADLKQIQISGPMWSGSFTVKLPELGDFALPALEKVGVYRLTPPIPQFEALAVNLVDDNESNLLPATTVPGESGETVSGVTGKSRLDLWWWIIACAAVPLCLIEWWVYTRRMHL